MLAKIISFSIALSVSFISSSYASYRYDVYCDISKSIDMSHDKICKRGNGLQIKKKGVLEPMPETITVKPVTVHMMVIHCIRSHYPCVHLNKINYSSKRVFAAGWGLLTNLHSANYFDFSNFGTKKGSLTITEVYCSEKEKSSKSGFPPTC